ncbi:MAG TPA: glycosyltransferase [Candidatus Solibacter sp.]|nr:glycosyltransferase [Candidatus Solibacter sp.]
MAKPFVSVLIDTYNHERFIEKAIASVLEQDFPASEREILVVDDGSTDGTAEIVRKFEPHLRLIRKANGGQASAFNAGIPECTGEIVSFLDGDDWWASGKLKRVAGEMASDSALGLVGHGIVIAHLDGLQQYDSLNEGFRFSAGNLQGARLFRLRKSFLGTSRMTIRAEVLRRIGEVPEALHVQADEYLFTLAAVLSWVKVLPEPLTFYRMHEGNLFQVSSDDPKKTGRKRAALALLASTLTEQLELLRVEAPARQAITEIVQAEADQMRLMGGGGWPWETLKTEWRLYDAIYPEASRWQRWFKMGTLLPSLMMPPKTFYWTRQKIAKSEVYLRARKRWLPAAELPHVKTEWRSGG